MPDQFTPVRRTGLPPASTSEPPSACSGPVPNGNGVGVGNGVEVEVGVGVGVGATLVGVACSVGVATGAGGCPHAHTIASAVALKTVLKFTAQRGAIRLTRTPHAAVGPAFCAQTAGR